MKKRIGLVLMALLLIISSFSFIQPINASETINAKVEYTVQSSWGTGAVVKIVIKNNGITPINGWNLEFKFPGNQKIDATWSSSFKQSGSSVEIGMNISYTGENKSPSEFTINSQKSNTGSTESQQPTQPNQPEQPTQPERKPTFHVFLLLGQSNMAGYPKAQAADKVKDERILVLGYDNNPSNGRVKDQWAVASAPLHEAWNDAVGPGDWFAKTLINKLPEGDTIGLVPCAISGEKIETFMKGGSKYNWILDRVRSAQRRGGVVDGIIFHQGESNCGDPSWPGKVNTLVEDLRRDLAIGNVPFIAGELLYTGGCSSHNRLVNQIPNVVKNSYVVSANGLTKDPSDQWNLHFSHDSQVTLGKRYAEKMSQALGW